MKAPAYWLYLQSEIWIRALKANLLDLAASIDFQNTVSNTARPMPYNLSSVFTEGWFHLKLTGGLGAKSAGSALSTATARFSDIETCKKLRVAFYINI